MSKYTTGEIASLCGVSVRTVQYYDTRGILIPSELTEGGRRLYSEADLSRMKIICFLRELDVSINSISELLREPHPENVLALLVERQSALLRKEIADKKEKLRRIEELSRAIGGIENFSVESIGDVANIMENKKKLRKMRLRMLVVGICAEAVEIGSFIYSLITGIWWPFVLGIILVVLASFWILGHYYKNVSYICPQCHGVFVPRMGEMIFAGHTLTTRKLTCSHCGHRGYCVETARNEK